VLTQREAVNDGWDLPKEATLKAFVETHPKYKDNLVFKNTWAWNWYYAFQQVGDQTAAELSQAYRDASLHKYELAGWVSLLSPPMLVQRSMTRMAETDALAAFEYEQQIRDFHKALRMFYYPFMFGDVEFEKQALNEMPDFEVIKTHVSE
jgi:ABC-2 type transport system permease protein